MIPTKTLTILTLVALRLPRDFFDDALDHFDAAKEGSLVNQRIILSGVENV